MLQEDIKNQILDVLSSKNLMSLQIDTSRISDDTSLLIDVGLDSIQILELIVGIERKFNFNICADDLDLEIFDNFRKLVNFVACRVN